MFNPVKTIAVLIAAITIISCSKESNPVNNNKTEFKYITVAKSGDYEVEILSKDTPITEGASTFYIKVKKDGEAISLNDIEIKIEIDTGIRTHSTPFEYSTVEIDQEKYLKVDAIFIMPLVEIGNWSLNLSSVSDELDLSIDIEVKPSGNVRKFIYKDVPHFLTLHEPMKAEVGMNDLIISLHKKVNNHSFPAVEDFEFKIEPNMPSMGHGSPNNENPKYKKKGIYEGKVNFTMTGKWEVKCELFQQGELIHTEIIDFEL